MEFLDSYFEDEVREGFYVPSLMKRAWAAQMELLEVVQNICDKHQIPLYAEWGTLLGAVRHKGRIPWDDDIDMCMLREDYEKFSKIIDAELPEDCWFIDFHRTKDVNLMLGRVMNSKFHVVEGELLEKYHGFPYVAGIDIFWLDSLPEDDRICRKYQEQINLIYRVLLALQYEECASKKMTRDEMEYHICQVEKMCGVSIRRNASLREQLADLLEKGLGKWDGRRVQGKLQMCICGVKMPIIICPKRYIRRKHIFRLKIQRFVCRIVMRRYWRKNMEKTGKRQFELVACMIILLMQNSRSF